MPALAVPNLANDRCEFSPYRWQQWYDIIHQHLGENETLFNIAAIIRFIRR